MAQVLVTGGSGFIGAHCILQLLAAGHAVRTTVRSRAREADVRAMLRGADAGADADDRLTFAEADLLADAGWAEAAAGCDYVLHVASPFPAAAPKHADELIVPARDGALRALRAARDAGAKRVVQTSSFAAIGYGHTERREPFDETTWTNLAGDGISAYVQSKTISERAAWDFIAKEGGALELAVVNPVGVFGPVLGKDISTSIQIVQRMLNGQVPGAPKIAFGVVDVRDVADLHVRAMADPAAKGERFLAVAGDFISVLDVATILRRELGARGRRAPRFELPNFLVRGAGLVDRTIRQVAPELGKRKTATNAKARRLLGWSPRTNRECILATANRLHAHGLVRDLIWAGPAPEDPLGNRWGSCRCRSRSCASPSGARSRPCGVWCRRSRRASATSRRPPDPIRPRHPPRSSAATP